MKKEKILPCPFCGGIPTGEKFCSTDRGPALTCDFCSTLGPPALEKELVGPELKRFEKLAVAKWNKRMLDSASYRRGIEAAASFVEQFDKYVSHSYLLSDCILGKFNLIGKRKIRKNDQRLVRAFSAAIRFFQISGNPQAIFSPGRRRAKKEFYEAMEDFCSHVDKRTPARRKLERRIPGGPEFLLGSLLSAERRQRSRREGAVRRRS